MESNISTIEKPVFNWKELSFEVPKSVPITEDGAAVSAMPSFDINSSVPEDSIQNTNPIDTFKGPSQQLDEVGQRADDVGYHVSNFLNRIGLQASKAVFIAKNFSPSVLTRLDQANFEAKNIENYPIKLNGEDDTIYKKRVGDFYNSYRGEQIAKGPLGQLDKEMSAALTIAAPGMTLEHWGTLIGGMGLMEGEKAIQKKFAPDTPEGINNIVELGTMLGSFKLSGKAVDGVSDFLADIVGRDGKSPTLDLLPDFVKNINDIDLGKLGELSAESGVVKRPASFVRTSQTGWPLPEIETPTGYMDGGTLEKLGVTEDQYNVSLGTGMPIRIPMSSIIILAKDDPEIKMKFDVAGWNTEDNASTKTETSIEQLPVSESSSKTPQKQAETYQDSTETQKSGISSVVSDVMSKMAPGDVSKDKISSAIRTPKGDIVTGTDHGDARTKAIEQGLLGEDDKVESGWVNNAGEWLTDKPIRKSSDNKVGDKVSKAASDINKDIVSKGFDELSESEQAKFTSITKEEQLSKVAKLIEDDYEYTKNMAAGDVGIPEDLSPQVIFNAVKNKAINEIDIDTLERLASSSLAKERSIHAQELSASGFDNGFEDPIKASQDISKAREKEVAEKTKDIDSQKRSTIKEIKKEIKKAQPKLKDWNDFIDSLEC